jgi:high-affinity Fe2+/Pb2+ permease
MIFGSVIGFLVAVGFGMANGSSWPNLVWHGCVAALIAAMLTRWWGRVMFNGLNEAIEQRRQASRNPVPETKTAAKV